MGDLTANFDRYEFRCRGFHCCGHSAPIALEFVYGLQALRNLLCAELGIQVHIYVTSGFRCRTHDLEEARGRGATPEQLAARNSQHCLGTAADVIAPAAGPDLLAALAERIPPFARGGIGRYTGSRHDMVHLDVRTDGPVRWTE